MIWGSLMLHATLSMGHTVLDEEGNVRDHEAL